MATRGRGNGPLLVVLAGAVVVALVSMALIGGGGPTGPEAPAGAGASAGPGATAGDPAADYAPGEAADFAPGPDLGRMSSTGASMDQIIEGSGGYIPGNTWWVMLDEGAGRRDAEALLARFDGDTDTAAIGGEIEYLDAYQFVIPEALGAELYDSATAWLESQPEVAAVAADGLYVAKGCADEMSTGAYATDGNDGAYTLIGAEAAWTAWFASGLRKHPVHVGVVDTPISEKPTKRPYEFDTATFTGDGPVTSSDPGMYDGFFHSDGVIGIIAADRGDDGIVGLASVLGSGLGITHVDLDARFTGAPGDSPRDSWYTSTDGSTTTYSDALINVMKAVESGATVINMSFGPPTPDASHRGESEMWRKFLAKMNTEHPEVLFVVAAGNEGTPGGSTGHLDGHNYGAAGIASPNLITVGNVRNDNTLAPSSNTLAPGAGSDAEVTLAAPGDQSQWGIGASGASMNSGNGTSSAAPMVTSTAALLRSLDPKLSAAQIKEIITRTARSGPSETGGRTLALDRAVLDVVNTLRVKAGQAALGDADLAAAAGLCTLDVTRTASAHPDAPGTFDWTLAARLPVVVDPTTATVTYNGLRPTDWRRPMATADDVATWKVEVPPQGVAAVVTRQDSGYWVRLDLSGGGPAVSPAPTPAPTPKPSRKPKPTPKPTPAGDYDCSRPPPIGTLKYLDWSLHCKGIAP